MAITAALLAAVLLAGAVWASPARARPERIRPGVAYYSAERVEAGGVSDLGPEKNYEEVFLYYRYYEAWYDDRGRVVRFIAYHRGKPVLEERYEYDAQGRPVRKHVSDGTGPARTVPLP